MFVLLIKYYGVDWLATIMSFLFVYNIGNRRRHAFVFGIIANFSWMTFGFMTGSIANVMANIVFVVLNIRGYLKWGKLKN